ncbi:MAG: Ig domain-containing protein [Gemmatimonadaceae bacterium]
MLTVRVRTTIALCFAAFACGGGGATGPAPIATIAVSLAKSSLVIGETTTATGTAKDASGNPLTGRAITWSTSTGSVATVSPAGVVTALTVGTTTITASSEGKSGTAIVTVALPPVATVTVTLASNSLASGATTQATATTRDLGGNLLTGRNIFWSSGNPLVATVNNDGLVTAVGAGSTTIVATSEGKSGAAVLSVDAAPIVSTTVSLASPTAVGSTTQATVTFRDAAGNVVAGKAVTWASDNTSVATVSLGGVVTSVALGTANISVTSNGPIGSAPMTVAPSAGFGSPAEKIRIVDIGTVFAPTLSGASAGSTTFTSRATSVARVDAQGRITGVAEGQAWVAATAAGFAPDSIFVIVPRNATGPILRSDLTSYNAKAGTTIVINVILDTRSTAIGGAELNVGYTTSPFVFSGVSVTPTGTPSPTMGNLQSGVIRLSLASADALTGQLSILRFTFTAPTSSPLELIANRSGYLTLTLIDLVGPNGADLLPVSTSTRIPIIITQ